MISIDTAVSCATQIRRWQAKHKVSEYKIEELLRWMSKCEGNASFNNLIRAISKAYKLQGDVGETEDVRSDETEATPSQRYQR